MSRRNRITLLLTTSTAWLLSLLILVPLVIVVFSSLKTKPEAAAMNLTLPTAIQWGNYAEAIKRGGLVRSFLNSLLIASVSATVCILVSSMAAFVLARNRTRFNKAVFNYIFLGLIAPINYITTIKVFQVLRIMNSYVGIILLYIALGIPFAVFAYLWVHARHSERARRSCGHRWLQSVAVVLAHHLPAAETCHDHRSGAQLHGRVE